MNNEEQTTSAKVLLALGSNLGHRENLLQCAVEELQKQGLTWADVQPVLELVDSRAELEDQAFA